MAMSSQWPSVSVVICAYNYERFVAESVDSALAQEYPADRLEIIVVDDGSTDATPDILARYADRVRVVRQRNAGLIAATTRGIEESTGDLVAILDADDAWRPDKLRRQAALLQARPEVGLVYSDKEMVDEHGRRIAPSFLAHGGIANPPRTRQLTHLLAYNFVPAPSIVFRREHADRILPFSPAATAQDWWIAIRVAQVALLDHVPLPLVRYRVHGSNMGIGSRGEKLRKLMAGFFGFQGWNLMHLDLDTVDAESLHAVWQRYLLNANQLAMLGDESVEDVFGARRDPAAAAASVGRAVEAFGAGQAQVAFRHLLAARVADPFDGDVRSAYEDVFAELQDAAAAERRAARSHFVRDHADPIGGELAWAEQRVAAGYAGEAAHDLQDLERRTAGTAAAARVSTALAVAAIDAGRPEIGARAGRDALRAGGRDAVVLRALGRASAAVGDTRSAVHWAAQATEVAPDDAAAWRELGLALLQRAHWAEGVAALDRAAALAPLPVDLAARATAARASAAAEVAAVWPESAGARGSLLICVDRLGARAGRLGRLAEGVALELKRLGWRVEAAARVAGDAPRGAKRGMTVHALRQGSPEEVERLLSRRSFDAVLVLGGPESWSVRHVPAAAGGRARLVILPSVTAANEAVVRDSPLGLRSFRELLAASAVVARHTRAGADARLYADLDVAAVDVPEPVLAVAPAGSLRRRLRLSPAPLLLAPSCPRTERDFAMLNALAQAPGDWSLVVAAPPAEAPADLVEAMAELARRDARITVADGLGGPLLAAGLREAAAVLAPSPDGTIAPAVLAAMAAGVPWIAAPGSAADECCGGLVTPHAGVAAAVHHLLSDPDLAAALGAAGRADAGARSLRTAAARLDALLCGADTLPPATAPAEAMAVTEAAQAAFLERDAAPAGVVAARAVATGVAA